MYAMLSLDLDSNTTSTQRDKFYEYLDKGKRSIKHSIESQS